MPTGGDGRNPVEQLAEEFLERARRGEAPRLSEYTGRYPHLAGEIRNLFPLLLEMEGVRPDSDDMGGATPDRCAGPPSASPRQLGDYRILREIGRGGMGIVYEAEQESLGRHVALKVLTSSARLDPKQLARFKREARSAARLHHTNVVPVFGVGEDDGCPYYVMQFIRGQGLDEVLRELRRLSRERSGATEPAGEGSSAEPRPSVAGLSAAEVANALRTGLFGADVTRRVHTDPDGAEPAAGGALGRPGEAPAAVAATVERPGEEGGRRESDPPSSAPVLLQSDSTPLAELDRHYWRGVARVGVQVAEALAYAHSQGVLHRDIKPSNLLLEAQGTVWVTDFGLAKAVDEADLTRTGDIVGTLRYMAPERFQNRSDERSDLFSLGLTLYELLTLRPAFDASNRERLIQQLADAAPTPPSQVNRAIPRDLETIVLKAIDRDPAHRYRAAAEMADDLRRFLEDRPIAARRAAPAERVLRWCRRNPALARLSAVAAVLFMTLVIGSIAAAIWFARERGRALVNLARARDAEARLSDQLWESSLLQARASRHSRQAGQRFDGLDALARAAKIRVTPALRDEVVASLARIDLRPIRRFTTIAHEDVGFAVDRELKRYAVGDQDPGVIRVFSIADGRELVRLPPGGGPCMGVGFFPGGRHMIAEYAIREGSGYRTRNVVWDLSDGGAGGPVTESPSSFYVSDDGRRYAANLSDTEIGVWDAGAALPRVRFHSAYPVEIAGFDPEARTIAACDEANRAVRLFDVDGRGEVRVVGLPVAPVGVAWRPDGRLMAIAGDDNRIYIRDVAEDRMLSVLDGHTNRIVHIEFTHRGDLLFTHSWDVTTRVWDPVRGRSLLTLPGAFYHISSDDRRVAFREPNLDVGIWELADGRECRMLHHGMIGNVGPRPDTFGPTSLSFSADGRLLASGGFDGVRLWDAASGLHLALVTNKKGETAEFSPDGSGLVIKRFDEAPAFWPSRYDGPGLRIGPPRPFGTSNLLVTSTATGHFDRQGRRFAFHDGRSNQSVVIDPSTGKELARLGPHARVHLDAMDPDGRYVATATWKGSGIKVWDIATGRLVWQLASNSAYAVFSPDGRWLVTARFPETDCRFWHVGTWQEGFRVPLSVATVGAMAFSGDGRLFAIADSGRIRIVETESGRGVMQLEPGDDATPTYYSLAFNADGTRLAAGRDHMIFLWDLRAIRAHLAAIGLDVDQPPAPPEPKWPSLGSIVSDPGSSDRDRSAP